MRYIYYMCAAWRCGCLVFRLRCRMVFPPAAFCGLSGAYSCRGAFSSVLPPFSPAVLRFVAAGRCCRGLCRFGFCRQIFLPKSWPHSSAADCCRCKGLFSGFPKAVFWLAKVVFCSPKGYLLHAERPPFRKWLFAASGIASRQPSGQGRAVPRQGHPEGIIRGVRRSEILLLFIVRNIKFYLKVNLCPDFVSYYLSVGSNVFA